jgi:hypothetical protein
MSQRRAVLQTWTAFMFIVVLGCSGPSSADLERERIARQAAEQRAEEQNERREEEQRAHESEKAKLWKYIFAIALLAVILLFVGTGIGSTALKASEQAQDTNEKRTSDTG